MGAGGSDDSVEEFAAALRELRREQGDPTLAALSDRTGISKSVISEALAGRKLPTERTVARLVDSFGAERPEWLARRHALDVRTADRTGEARGPGESEEATADPTIGERRSAPRFSTGQAVVIAAVSIVLGAVVASGLFLIVPVRASEADAPGTVSAEGEQPKYRAAENGTDPMLTECREDAVIAGSRPVLGSEAQVQMLYSNECMAAWGRVTRYDGESAGGTLTMRVYPVDDPEGERLQKRSAEDVQSLYTPMLIEPDVEARVCGVAEIASGGKILETTEPLCI